MLEMTGDITKLFDHEYVCIPTNGRTNFDGDAIMGAGVAKLAKEHWPSFPEKLGKRLDRWGNRVYYFPEYRAFSFPTKDHWQRPASMFIIEDSIDQIVLLQKAMGMEAIYLPRPGTGLGQLSWRTVRSEIVQKLSDNFVIVSLEGADD